MEKCILQFGISSVSREKHLFSERNKNIIITIIHISRTRCCKRRTNKNKRKYVAIKHKTNNSFSNKKS